MNATQKIISILKLTVFISTLFIFLACEDDDEYTNSAPTCAITSPADSTTFTLGEAITISAEAEDQDNNLKEVRFYINDIGVSSATSFPYNYEWDTSEEEPGNFTIRVEAIDEDQEKASDEITIILNASGAAPLAAFNANQIIINENDSLTFTDLSTNEPTSWSWNFGDGNTSSEANPSHTYSIAGKYTVELTVSNDFGSDTETKTDYITVSDGTVTDIDGNTYNTVIIGNQEWMAENLKTTSYNNGTAIDQVSSNTSWQLSTTGAYCWYDNDQAQYADTYGALYNWYAIETGNLCPDGWHVPTHEEWKTLEIYLGMDLTEADNSGYRGTNEGSKLAGHSSLWANGDLQNNNEFGTSGFNGIPGGMRYSYGEFGGIEGRSYWWSAEDYAPDMPAYRSLSYDYTQVRFAYDVYEFGFSVRCLRD